MASRRNQSIENTIFSLFITSIFNDLESTNIYNIHPAYITIFFASNKNMLKKIIRGAIKSLAVYSGQ